MQSDLSLLIVDLSSLQRGTIRIEPAQTLDGILNTGVDVDSQINHTVGTGTKDFP